MSKIPGLRRFFRSADYRPDVEGDIDTELEFHLGMKIDELVKGGLSPEAARREALRRFGDVERTRAGLTALDRERLGRERRAEWWSVIAHDARHALRTMRRTPGATLVIILTLALGIGANATMFGIVDRLLLRPPTYLRDVDRTGRVYLHRFRSDGTERIDNNISYRYYGDIAKFSHAIEASTAFFDDQSRVVGTGQDARERPVSLVGAGFWSFFDARPALGRFFLPDDDRGLAGPAVTVLGYGFWQSNFGGDRGVLGKSIRIGSRSYTIIGVAPRGFNGLAPWQVAAFIPVTVGAYDFLPPTYRLDQEYGASWVEMLVRRKPGVTVAQANADLTAAFRESRRSEPQVLPAAIARSRAEAAGVLYDQGPKRSESAKVATWLVGVSAIVLLIACANVANLLLARALGRRREIAVRIALGAGRGRLLAQLLTESTLLALLGALAGLVVAQFGGGVLRRTLLPDVDWSLTPLFDQRTLLITTAMAVVTGVLTGLAPALQAGRADVSVALKAGGREGNIHRSRLRATLLVIQAGLSVVLLVGAGLFVQSLRNVQGVDMGYEPDRILHMNVELGGLELTRPQRIELRRRMLETLRARPGVEHAAVTSAIPFWQTIVEDLFVPGRDSSVNGQDFIALNAVSGDYFATAGTRIVRGRAIMDSDRPEGARVVVVSETLAQKLWPGRDALAQCVKVAADTMPCASVVGIAGDVRWGGFGDDERMQIYVPLGQYSWLGAGSYYVRTTDSPARVADGLRRAVQALVPGNGFVSTRVLATTLDSTVRPWRLGATMFTVFGMLALLVAAVGLYGVVAYGVTQRMHEMGVRVALGARTRDVLRLVVGEGVRVTVIGIVLGTIAAILAGRFIAALLFRVSPRDPATFVIVGALLLAVAVAASLIPAWRASRVDPLSALRAD
jgi:putative ABC transport system permease protein